MTPPETPAFLASARATVVAGCAVLLLVAAAGWFLALGPATSAIGETRTRTQEAADRVTTLELQLARLQALAADLGETRDAEAALTALVPPTADQPGFFAAFTEAARRAGYSPDEVTALSPTAPEAAVTAAPTSGAAGAAGAPTSAPDPDAYAVQTVTIAASGTLAEAGRLLRALERLPRAVLVRAVMATASDDDVVVTVTGRIFVAPAIPAPSGDAG